MSAIALSGIPFQGGGRLRHFNKLLRSTQETAPINSFSGMKFPRVPAADYNGITGGQGRERQLFAVHRVQGHIFPFNRTPARSIEDAWVIDALGGVSPASADWGPENLLVLNGSTLPSQRC
jgi:hypothetical protein